MKGVYQQGSKKHLQRYLAECEFRYNRWQVTDEQRSDNLQAGIVGKRLIDRHSIQAVKWALPPTGA
jgi:hypothetical protein